MELIKQPQSSASTVQEDLPVGFTAVRSRAVLCARLHVCLPSRKAGSPHRALGKECYTRDSAERLLEMLHLASKKTNLVSQYPTFKLFGFLLFSSNLKV